jgi:hypothetical protein
LILQNLDGEHTPYPLELRARWLILFHIFDSAF